MKSLLTFVVLCFSTTAVPASELVLEYYHAEFDHYFMTGNPDEIAQLDAGVFSGWARTGHAFGAYVSGEPATAPMCRFFSTSFAPKSSHFYTPIASECALVKSNPDWQFEGEVFNVSLADANGVCSAGTVPLYRYYNNGQGGAPNHRYATSRFMRQAMLDAGWIPEGYGDGVIACVLPSVSFGNGIFLVGVDVQPGSYRTREIASGCYFERLSGFTGSSAEIIANDFTNAPAIVTIAATDKGFSSSGCSAWTQDLSAITASQTSIPDGTFIVGTDIQSGTYRTRSPSPGCYFERLQSFSATSSDIIANDLTNAPAVIAISPSDKGFSTSNCGTWTQDLSQITASQTSFGDGVFIVGTDVQAGTYRSGATTSACYYARLKGFSGESSDIIANNFTQASTIVTILSTDKGFQSDGCGTWTQV